MSDEIKTYIGYNIISGVLDNLFLSYLCVFPQYIYIVERFKLISDDIKI